MPDTDLTEQAAVIDPSEYGYNSAGERTWTGWNPTKPTVKGDSDE